jgi:hypothetical protein
MSSGKFSPMLVTGLQKHDYAMALKGGLNLFFTLFILAAVLLIVSDALMRWLRSRNSVSP